MNENRRRCVLVEVVGMVVPLGTSGQTFKFIWTDLKVCCTTTGNETIGIATGAQCISSNGVCPLCRGPSDALRDAAHKTPRTIYASRTRDAFLCKAFSGTIPESAPSVLHSKHNRGPLGAVRDFFLKPTHFPLLNPNPIT